MLLLSIFGSLSLMLAARRQRGRWRWFLLAAAGGVGGLAVGVKFTGLIAPAMLVVLSLVDLMRRRTIGQIREWTMILFVVSLSAVLVYGAGWALHFALLPNPGSGDDWRVPRFEAPLYRSFVREVAALHTIMFDANYGLEAQHPDESVWWEWPLMRTSVFYWQADDSDGRVAGIYLLGNPLVWWGSTILLVSLIADLFSRRLLSPHALRQAGLAQIWIPLLGYVAALAPLARVPRALFLYHYLTSLLFAILAIMLWLDTGGFVKRSSLLKQPRHYFFVLGAIVFFFLVFSPLTYGFLISPSLQNWLFWLPTWR
jgi:dolichyl-phosphate-mannose--protein O-mannosyl transferase